MLAGSFRRGLACHLDVLLAKLDAACGRSSSEEGFVLAKCLIVDLYNDARCAKNSITYADFDKKRYYF